MSENEEKIIKCDCAVLGLLMFGKYDNSAFAPEFIQDLEKAYKSCSDVHPSLSALRKVHQRTIGRKDYDEIVNNKITKENVLSSSFSVSHHFYWQKKMLFDGLVFPEKSKHSDSSTMFELPGHIKVSNAGAAFIHKNKTSP